MTLFHRSVKRLFDIVGSAIGLIVAGPVILVAILAARHDTRKTGLFRQTRIGMHGQPFQLLKIRTMGDVPGFVTTVTTDHDPRITPLGRLLRKTKIDELPQLINVLRGEMSFVGPRPDVAELMASLSGEDRVILSVRPGITGPASIKYRSEESLLAAASDPERHSREVIFPDKVRINRRYIADYRLWHDVVYLWQTIVGVRSKVNTKSGDNQIESTSVSRIKVERPNLFGVVGSRNHMTK